jgi:hypothetical protein
MIMCKEVNHYPQLPQNIGNSDEKSAHLDILHFHDLEVEESTACTFENHKHKSLQDKGDNNGYIRDL